MLKANHFPFQIASFMLFFLLTMFSVGAEMPAITLAPLPDMDGHFLRGETLDGDEAVTLQAMIRFDDEFDTDAVQGIHLAGVGATPNGSPTALSLVWTRYESETLSQWVVLLQSDAGLIPTRLDPMAGPDFVQNSHYIFVHALHPENDRDYSVELSYHPVTGEMIVGMVDVSNSERLFSKKFIGEPISARLTPGAGVIGDATGIQFKRLDAVADMIPLSVTLDLLVAVDGVRSPFYSNMFMEKSGLYLRLNGEGVDVDGRLILHVVDGECMMPLVSLLGQEMVGEHIIPIPVDELPLGDIELRLHYRDQFGARWLLGTRRLQRVVANVNTSYSQLILENDQLRGTVIINSEDNVVSDTQYEIRATIGDPDYRNPRSMITVTSGTLERIDTRAVEVPFVIPLSEDSSEFSLVLDTVFSTPLNVKSLGAEYHGFIVD